jgi:hypothetical protein
MVGDEQCEALNVSSFCPLRDLRIFDPTSGIVSFAYDNENL